jgi:tetratricopeptide (TPR) repeat protein
MSNNQNNWPVLLLGGIATFAAITSAGYIYNKLQAEDIPTNKQAEERVEDEIEVEIRRQELKANPVTLSRLKKMSLMAKLEILIRELEVKSKYQNPAIMQQTIDEIQKLIEGEPAFHEGVSDPDVIFLLSGMYAIIGDFVQQKKCLLKCSEKFDPLSAEYLSTCQRLVSVCVILMNFEESSKWAKENLESWKKIASKANTPKNNLEVASAHSSYAITAMRVGKFQESKECFKIALKLFSQYSPVHEMCFNTLKNYLATLIISGDVVNARIEADLFLRQLEDIAVTVANKTFKNQHIDFIIQVYHTFGCLLRNNENFDFAVEYLERGEKYGREFCQSGVPLQLLIDSANLYWQLDNKEKASEKEQQVRDFKMQDGFKALVPLSRSKYLQSTFAVLIENYFYLKIQLLPKLESPRLEGVEISAEVPVPYLSIKEKLTLNVTFENTAGDTFVQQFFLPADQKDLVIQSKIMEQKAKIYQFYKVCIDIVDEDGSNLGQHHQLVLSPNPADIDMDAFLDSV